MKLADKERGANVRRNLRRWWKPLLMLVAGWILLTLTTGVGAFLYARAHHFTRSRTQALAESCAVIMCLVFMAAWLTVLVMADRRKPGPGETETRVANSRKEGDD